MPILHCSLPAGHENYRPEPFPGSDEAVEKGCLCPKVQPWPGRLELDNACPVHEISVAGN